MRKTTNANCEAFYKAPDQYFSRLLRSSNYGKPEKLSKRIRAPGNITTKCGNFVSWMEPWKEKKTFEKKEENMIELYTLANDNISILISCEKCIIVI